MLFTTLDGWMVIIPTFMQLFLLAFLIIIVFFIGRATALSHLVKYHLSEIEKDEIGKLNIVYSKLKLDYDKEKKENEIISNKLQGIHYILSRK